MSIGKYVMPNQDEVSDTTDIKSNILDCMSKRLFVQVLKVNIWFETKQGGTTVINPRKQMYFELIECSTFINKKQIKNIENLLLHISF